MTKHERAKLSAAMRQLIANMLLSGERVTTSEIYERAIEELPDLVEEAKERLFRQSLTNMARGILKEAMKGSDEGSEMMQVSLFGNSDPGLQVPRCIALPAPEGGREMVWTPTLQATLAELDSHIKYLNSNAAADVAKAKKLAAFYGRVIEVTNGDDFDIPIQDLLQGLKERTA